MFFFSKNVRKNIFFFGFVTFVLVSAGSSSPFLMPFIISGAVFLSACLLKRYQIGIIYLFFGSTNSLTRSIESISVAVLMAEEQNVCQYFLSMFAF